MTTATLALALLCCSPRQDWIQRDLRGDSHTYCFFDGPWLLDWAGQEPPAYEWEDLL